MAWPDIDFNAVELNLDFDLEHDNLLQPRPCFKADPHSALTDDFECLGGQQSTLSAQRPDPKPSYIKTLSWHFVETFIPETKWEKVFVAAISTQSLVCIVCESLVFWQALRLQASFGEHLGSSKIIMMQSAVVIFESLYQMILALDAGRRKNIVQVLGIVLNNLAMLACAALAMVFATDVMESLAELNTGTETTIPFSLGRVVQDLFIVILAALSATTLLLGVVG